MERKSATWCKRYRESKTLVLLLVCLGFFIDYTLITTIVPIIPELLYNIEHPDVPLSTPQNKSTASISSDISNIFEDISNLLAGNGTGSSNVTIASPYAIDADNKTAANLRSMKHTSLMHETVEIGFLSSTKFVVQLIVTPLVGHFIPQYGYNGFMLYGFVSMFLASVIYAFGETFLLLILAKCLQGYGAAGLSVSGLTMLADIYQDHKERGTAIGLSLQGLALGNLVGPVFGGVMYELYGKTQPFLILAAISLIGICKNLTYSQTKDDIRILSH
ncbi:hypothetical protein V9T40_001518 [Parthenolecanium corni]|uniref:Major facilitator superfamily (MFS) profile domain-containing protein n=1 Tax=Parthenolecanium corni TaxID=536013 RepID=A0AAN9TMQ8_9HEMI